MGIEPPGQGRSLPVEIGIDLQEIARLLLCQFTELILGDNLGQGTFHETPFLALLQ
jgi:hypothetical protein